MGKLQSIKGMNDILPSETQAWQKLEKALREVFYAYAYQEIRLPLLEKTSLFARSIGEDTDVVGKEMYTFEDRNGESVTLRPEGTASCMRAGIQHGLFHNQKQRLWYMGPMFRHERPQRGRYRQFHQAGAEAVGWEGPDVDAELIALGTRLWSALAIPEPELQLNSLGDPESRKRYRTKLVDYLNRYQKELDEDSQRRLLSNPLRILDSKNETTQNILQQAPLLSDYLDIDSKRHLDSVCGLLTDMGIKYVMKPHLVRGLDYYTRTVFEWVSVEAGTQATICAGGRYDGLIDLLGGKPTPGIGFAMGLERLIEISNSPGLTFGPKVYIAVTNTAGQGFAMALAEELRNYAIDVELHCGAGKLKNQLSKADKSGAELAVIIGENEISENTVTVKHLRSNQLQQVWARDQAVPNIKQLLMGSD